MVRQPRQDYDALIAAYLAGASVAELAQQFGIAASTVYTELHRAQVPIRPRTRSLTAPLAPAEIAAISAAYQAGETMTTLATRFGLSRVRVARVLHAAGGTRRLRKARAAGTGR